MNIDKNIQERLEDESAEIDRILGKNDDGLWSMLASGFRGSMRRWFIVVNIIVIINTGFLFWCGYQFFTAEVSTQTFWGVLLVICFQFHLSAKQWIANEMNRTSLVREIKRLEIAISDLADR